MSAQTCSPPKYDVAISFLAKDEPTAAVIRDGLASSLGVFFFSRVQEDLAGTDGLESMRSPFLTGSRVNVVLHREKWGQTPWTRVEETAIKDACLNKGWSSLFFICLDRSTPPIWLPATHIRFNLDDYGIQQAIGAIKARVQECGGTIVRASAAADAIRVHREATFLADRERLFRSQEWIDSNVGPAVKAAFAAIGQITEDIRGSTGMRFQFGANEGQCVLRNDRVSFELSWRQLYVNVISEDALFTATEFNAQIGLPDERLLYRREPPKLRQYRFRPELSLDRTLCWVDERSTGELLTPENLADRCVRLFLDLVARANRREIPPASF